MSRYTFTCEHFNYNDYYGKEESVASKHTTEFRADGLDTMLENYEIFLRASGFYFEGKLDIVNPDFDEFIGDESDDDDEPLSSSSVFSHMVNDIITNPINFDITTSKPDYSIKQDYVLNEDSMNFTYSGAAMPTYTVGSIDDGINFDVSNLTLSDSDYTVSVTEDDLSQMSFTFEESENDKGKCSLCKLPISVMQLHQCFDPKCPCGAYRSQYNAN